MTTQKVFVLSYAALLVASAACGSSSDPTTSANDAGESDAGFDVSTMIGVDAGVPHDAASVSDGGPVGDEGPPPITVAGHAVDQRNTSTPLVSRGVVLLDANGTRTALTTDGSGAFQASGIVPPYDAMVAAGANASDDPPVVYLGLSTAHAQLGGFTDDAPCAGGTGTVEVPVQLPACSTSGCTVSISLSSNAVLSSPGYRETDYIAGPNLLTASLTVTWCGGASVDVYVNVLASDFAYLSYFYGASGVSVSNGATARAGTVVPTAIPTIGMTTITASSTGIPAAWDAPSLNLYFDYPNDAGFAYLPQVQGTSLVVGVPDILGATLSAQAIYGDLVQTDNPRGSAGAAVTSLPLSTTTYALAVKGPPTMTSPPNGDVLPSSGAITWTAAPNDEVMEAYLATTSDAGEDHLVGEVLTSGEAIDLGRLALLGLALPAADYDHELVGYGKVASLNAMVDEQTLAAPDGTETSGVEYTFAVAP